MNAIVGVATFLLGIILVLRHLHVWRLQTDGSDQLHQKRFLWNQLRRRVLTSSCIALLGFVITLLHFREYWIERPTSRLILAYCAIALTLMIFCLAVLDMLAVSIAIRNDRERTNDAAEELAEEYHRLKKKAADQSSEPDSVTDKASEQP